MDVLYGFRGLTFLRYYSLTLFMLATQPSKIFSFPGEHIGALLHFHCVFFFLCCHVCLICLWAFLSIGPPHETADWCLGELGWMGQVQSELWWWSQLSAAALLFPKVKNNLLFLSLYVFFCYWTPALMFQYTSRTKKTWCLIPGQ